MPRFKVGILDADTRLVITAPAQHARNAPSDGVVRRIALWLPLALVLAALVASAATGRGPVASASAATTLDVTGLVDEFVYLDAVGCSAPASLAIGDLVPNDPWKQTTADCAVLFGTSNSSFGADLQVLEDPSAPVAPADAMKCVAGSCGSAALDDVAPNSITPTGSTSAFGIQLDSTTGQAAPVWSTGRANPVAAASTACNTSAIGDGTCLFRFGASADTNDGPGAYQAQVQFLVLAR